MINSINEFDGVSVLDNDDFALSNNIYCYNPTVRDITHNKKQYYKNLYLLISSVLDIADILWCEKKIWYEDIKNEWEFFIQKCIDTEPHSVKFVKDGKLLEASLSCVALAKEYRDALNFFLRIKNSNGEIEPINKNNDAEYIILDIGNDDYSQKILYQGNLDSLGFIRITDQSIKFTQHHYELMVYFLKTINFIKHDYMFLKGGNRYAKQYILNNDYKTRQWNEKHPKKNTVDLESITVSLIAKGQNKNELLDYSVYLFFSLYYRFAKFNEYDNTMKALYSGCLDTQKNPIDWEKINWSSVI